MDLKAQCSAENIRAKLLKWLSESAQVLACMRTKGCNYSKSLKDIKQQTMHLYQQYIKLRKNADNLLTTNMNKQENLYAGASILDEALTS